MGNNMSEKSKSEQKIPDAVNEKDWGESSDDNYGYASDEERRDKRGLEDWEMVSSMEKSEAGIPFWFIAIFFVLLLVAVGLTFPFWGNRPGYERPWFDWGIPAGVAWVVVMSALIYYFVDLRHVLKKKKEEAKKAQEEKDANEP